MPAASTELVERSDDLAPIEAGLSAATEGEGSLTLLSGPAGIGKTALLRAACELGRSCGFTVLDATGSELEREFPFGVARRLYGRVHERPGAAASEGAVASIFGPVSEEEGSSDVSFQILDGLYWIAADISQETPLLIAVDDVQWSDEPSLRHLLYLCRRLDGLRVCVVVAERSGEASPAALEDLRDLASARIDPAPFSLGGVEEMAQRILGQPPSPAFASACLEQTGGYPLYVSELLREARERDIKPGDAAAPELGNADAEGLARHVWRRIEGIGPDAGSVVGLVSVLGERAEPGRIGRLGELAPAGVAETLDELAAKGILEGRDPPRFTHPVVRAAVEARLPAGQLDGWHRGAARLLDREGADVREVAGHLVRCQPEGDEWAVQRLRELARGVSGRGGPEAAAGALRRALAEPPPEELRVPLLRELARAEDATGESAAALAHLDEALRLAGGRRERAEIAVDRFRILSLLGDYEEALAAIDAGLEALDGDNPELEQLLDAELIKSALASRDFRQRGFERLARYGGEVPDGPAAQATLTAMAVAAGFTRQPAAEVARLAERALQAGGFRGGGISAEAWTIAAWTLVFADRPDLARALAEREWPTVRREGHRHEIFALESTLAFAAWRLGDIPTAVSRAQAGLTISDPGRHEAWGLGVAALALLDAGDPDAVEQTLAAASIEHWDVETGGSFALRYARAQLRIHQGCLDDSAADLEEMRRCSEAFGAGLRTFDDLWRIVAVTLAHRRGEVEQARALAAEELEFARAWGGLGYLGQVLRAAALVDEPERGIELLRESVAVLAPSPFRLERARSLVELGAALRRRGERVAAREPLGEGLDLAYRCGASVVVNQAVEELRASGARPRRAVRDGVEALTPGEARVALLAAEGRSNREIAQELYVTLKTVEGTLGRAYAKLGISGRGAREALPEALEPLRGA